jgi:hypothetical protein
MNGRVRYYLSRALISLAFGCVFLLAGASWWLAPIVAAVTFGFFLWAPLSGRYVVDEESGAGLLRRDERSEAISGQAARCGWGAIILSLGVVIIYYGLVSESDVPVAVLSLVLVVGSVVYWATDLWLRRT